MSSDDNKVSGPDFTQGVTLKDFDGKPMLLGHVGDESVLLARVGDEVLAVSSSCTHYGGPLEQGAIHADTVICPWHNACFSLRTGEAVGAPAFDPIACWQVERDGERYIVRSQHESSATNTEIKGAPENVVIIGGGAAGFACAEMLRRRGYSGSITMLSADHDAPVDRPNLSKDFLAGTAEEAWMPLRSAEFYTENNIDLQLGTHVKSISTDKQVVVTDNGKSYKYDRLLIATGASPVQPDIAGSDLPHVFTLRSYQDSRDIVAASGNAKSAVVLGSGFIGLEVAASLRERGLDVHVVSMDKTPLEKVMGKDVGEIIRHTHESHDVAFEMETTIERIEPDKVTLKNGKTIDADLVIIGVGVKPNTRLADEAGMATDKGILVSPEMATEHPGVYAAGDVARWNDGTQTHRVEHWVVAERQGQIAAENMLGAQLKYNDAPFFWSAHYDVTIRYAGDGMGWDDYEIEGNLDDHNALVRYTKAGDLIAVAGIGRDAQVAELSQSLKQ